MRLTAIQRQWLSSLSNQAWCLPKPIALALLKRDLVRISVHCDEAGHYPVAITAAGRRALEEGEGDAK